MLFDAANVPENRYVKYSVHNSWIYESNVLTNRIAGKRTKTKKIKLLKDEAELTIFLEILLV